MAENLFVELFRFNHQTDYLPYYKKYTLQYDNKTTLSQLLATINKKEAFTYEDNATFGIKVNGVFTTLSQRVNEFVKNGAITIEPISTHRVTNDLIIDMQDYEEKLYLFKKYCSEEELNEYFHKYQLLYYSSNTLNHNRNYIGDHALLIAYDIIESKPALKDDVLSILEDDKNGIWYHTSLKNRLYDYNEQLEEKIQYLFSLLPISINEESNSTDSIIIEEVSQRFDNFNIASYEGINLNPLDQLVEKSGAKFISLDSKNVDLATHCNNKNFSHKIAGELLLEAVDNNADFILINNEEYLSILDQEQKKIEKIVGRDIRLPIVTKKQFIQLLNGEKDTKKLDFDSHLISIPFI